MIKRGYITLLEGVGASGSKRKKHIYEKREGKCMRLLVGTANHNINVKQFVVYFHKHFVNNIEVV